MRIVHVIDYFHTDVGYQEYYLAKFQARRGHAVRVVSSTFRHHSLARPGPGEARGEQDLRTAGVELVRLPAIQLGHDRAWLRGLTDAVVAFQPDAVHAHNPFAPTTVRVARACEADRIPLLVDSHLQASGAVAASGIPGRAAYRLYRSLFGPYLRHRVGAWVTDAPLKTDFLATHLGVPTESIDLVPLGFDPDVFGFDGRRRAELREERGWADDLVVAVTGKLYRDKRVDLVAAACEQAAARAPVRLAIAGTVEPDALAAARQVAPHFVEAGRLEVLPFLDRHELQDLYLAADVVVFPRLTSISIFEAAATGVRVLLGRDASSDWTASLHPGIRSVDPHDFAAHLEAEPDRPARALEAAEVFAWPVISDAFVARYQAIAGRPSVRS